MRLKSLSILLFFGLLFSFNQGYAQDSDIPKTRNYFDVAGGVGDGIFTGAFSWSQTHGINSSNKLRIGYGVRFSAFGGNNLTYITAPAHLTSDVETIDSLHVNNAMTMGVSATINLEYAFNEKLTFGFNIDAVGLGLGPATDATFESSIATEEMLLSQSASPTSLNLLLVGDNDIGHLKSEFYVAYALSEKTMIRAGLDMTFSEYTTANKLTHDNDRFRYKAMMFFAAFSFNLF
jgi:hypothetical protein